jgi:hypothetical protein
VNDEASLRPGTRRAAGHADPVERGDRSDQRDEGRAAESDTQIQQAPGPVANREGVSRDVHSQETIRMFSFVKSLFGATKRRLDELFTARIVDTI